MTIVTPVGVIIIALGGVLGLVIGSFLNVVIYRVPNGISVVAPASACPQCGHRIQPLDNIPVLSWLLLRGRCRDCRTSISVRYPAVELLTAGLFVAAAAFIAPTIAKAATAAQTVSAVLSLGAFLYLAAVTVALAAIDLDVKRLPDAIVLPTYAVGGVLLGVSSAVVGDGSAALRAGVGLAAAFVFYFALAFAVPGGMGFGDVKLAGVIGLYLGWLGWQQLIIGTTVAFLVGGIVGLGVMIARRRRRGVGIPFGPWMLVGAWTAIFAGPELASGYMRLVGLG